MNGNAPFVFAILIPMLYPFLVPLGLHWPLNALMLVNIEALGYDFIQGPMGAWNFMFRCHSRCLGHLHARKGPRNAPDLWFCSRCWSIRWYFRTVALRYSPALQAHLSTHAGRLFRRWSDHRHLGHRLRRRDHFRLRLYLLADHPGLLTDADLRHRRC